MKSLLKLAALLSVAVLALSGCYEDNSSHAKEAAQQEQLNLQAVQAVGMPAITNFAERRMMKDILELRDKDVATTTYTRDMNGRLHKICDSVGYGLPYATQFTNPQTEHYVPGSAGHWSILPQADPNGLYSPAAAEGTWVMCVNHKTGKPAPVYIEDRVTVSPMELESN
jgi:hypothetical protein